MALKQTLKLTTAAGEGLQLLHSHGHRRKRAANYSQIFGNPFKLT
jgi:hypothetical protein